MKAVMYHYIRPDPSEPPHYYYLDVEDFKAQLDHFEDKYGFVDQDEFLAACTGEGPFPEEGVVLTFDDGLVDHYEWALPELASRGLWGIFYVPTAPLDGWGTLDVHRIHSLLGTYGGERVLQELEPLVTEAMIPEGRREEFRESTYTRQQNAESTTRVKQTLNYFVAEEHRRRLLDRLVEALPDAAVEPSTLYMDGDQIRAIRDAGMVVGSHTATHRVLSKLSVERQRTEISESFESLETILGGLSVKTFCYPYGGSHSFTDETRRILTGANCAFSFSVESRDVTAADFAERPQALPRYDCNEFEHGAASGTLG